MTSPATQTADVTVTEFRQAMGCFATGVTVVTSTTPEGLPVGTTASAVSSLSLAPPLLLVCFDLASLTLGAIRANGAFAVNVLSTAQRHLSAGFARRGSPVTWDGIGYHLGTTGAPLLAGVVAALECGVEHRFPGGDHEIVVGRVRRVATGAEGLSPLLHWRGGYCGLAGHPAAPSGAVP